VIDAISQGAASSWQMQHRWQSMLAGDFAPRFANKWMAKDLAICLDEAERHQADLPLTRLISGFYEEMLAQGDGELDITSLMQRLS
jgi:3-hydroxyisobutyrate dehydrogenase-like beta-hydroxyacid dehydrogenase